MSSKAGLPPARKLPSTAYEIKPGETFVPLTHGETLTEFTWKAVITGILLGVVFGAANTYLGLMAGLTISTSIPVAVLTVVTFRLFTAGGLQHSILESNISQTVGSASSSVASGVLFTIPALFIWGMSPAWGKITVLAMAGGLVGVLFMIPLRRYLIKREHGTLPYPEGMACAEVLVAAEGGGKQAHGVFWGIGAGMLFQLLTQGLKFVKSTWELALPFKASIAAKVNAPLLGVGYILGIRNSHGNGGGWRPLLPRHHPPHQPLGAGLSRARLPRDGEADPGHVRRGRSGTATSGTSEPEQWPRRESSRW